MSNLDTLNNRQREAALAVEGPVLILAGAGSGKTRVLVHRISYMIEDCGIQPWNILAITFTNKAAGEMRERVDRIIGNGADSVWVATFHSTCVRILRRHIDLLGYDTDFTIYDTDDQKTVMKGILKRLNIDSKQFKEKTCLNTISNAKNELIDPVEFAKNCVGDYKLERIAVVYTEYQKTLKESNALDFDDIIMLTVRLFKEYPQVLENYQNRFRYIMVDEYQDTNTAQFELIRLLAAKYQNLCVVGDDDQSIYKFRGANISNILDFEKEYPQALVVKLEQNYRSTQYILDAANSVISNNSYRKSKSLWTDRGDGNKVHFRQFENAFEEADYIAGDARKSINSGEFEAGDCAVLYRTNAQSRLLEEAFVRIGIPYNIVGGVNFYSRKEIKDILAYLKVINNAVDPIAVKRIINIPKRGIGVASINKVEDYCSANGFSFFEGLKMADEIPGLGKAAVKIEGFVNMIRVFRSKIDTYGLKGLVEDILETTGYIEELRESEEDDAEDRIANIEELISKIVDYEDDHEEASLTAFLEEVALVSDIDNIEDEKNRVMLMTVHAAKGLEFGKVYMAGMEDGVFPGSMAIYDEDPSEIEEERRLAYVGITRAKDDLTLCYAKQRMLRGETQYNAPSRFIREIPDAYMDNKPAKRKEPVVMQDDSFREAKKMFAAKAYTTSTPMTLKRPNTTPEDKRPFIGQGINSLRASAGIQKGMPAKGKPDYEVGDRVRHMKFGDGTVINIDKEPTDYKVTVDFEKSGRKVMYAAFAKLRKI
ncbi:MAG: DNA helicase PcrA [Lachnospiraceae bacterium]|nr:DNA helicase PcrA [Lachnospiraceae bacterium]